MVRHRHAAAQWLGVGAAVSRQGRGYDRDHGWHGTAIPLGSPGAVPIAAAWDIQAVLQRLVPLGCTVDDSDANTIAFHVTKSRRRHWTVMSAGVSCLAPAQ